MYRHCQGTVIEQWYSGIVFFYQLKISHFSIMLQARIHENGKYGVSLQVLFHKEYALMRILWILSYCWPISDSWKIVAHSGSVERASTNDHIKTVAYLTLRYS